MQRLILALIVTCLVLPPLPVSAQGGGSCNGLGTLIPMGYEDIAVSSTAIGPTAATIQTATTSASYAYWYVASNAIRYRDDGTSPTATVGIPVAASNYGQTCGKKAVSQLKFIRQSADATVNIAYYRGE